MPLTPELRKRIRSRLAVLYPDDADAVLQRLERRCDRMQRRPPADQLWTERDVVLITYADQIRDEGRTPLQALRSVLLDHHLEEGLNAVHLLPFSPYSSDDGFSVIDYREVDPASGTWNDVAALGENFDLMYDLVLNHCSQQHQWFQGFLACQSPYDRYFHVVDPATDLSRVTRPRSTPLLTPCETASGVKYVWTTFSADQVDLNYANPDVFVEMMDVFLDYVARGARIVRLDAIAYLWKKIGTTCIHLPETHLVVKVMRELLEAVAPGVLLLTETNVPFEENISYFGDGDEAQMVYQFSLPPLLLEAMLSGDAGPLGNWLRDSQDLPPHTTVLNFTASHDGVGVRPLEGLISRERLDWLVTAVRERGGHVSTRRRPDGSDAPYELNITYFSALAPENRDDVDLHVRRFLTSQGCMLALKGMPAVYVHSLLGTPNWEEGVAETGRPRTINRRKFARGDLEAILADPDSAERKVFDGYRRLLKVRRRQRAFHPDAPQELVESDNPAVAAFIRGNSEFGPRVMVAANFSDAPVSIQADSIFSHDLISGTPASTEIPPGGIIWLRASD
jgi:glucosylglycerate phosphorylase